MKFLLLLSMSICSCQMSREVVLPNGMVYRDLGHLGGDSLAMFEPDGTVILRSKQSKSFQDFLQAAGLAYVANRGAAVDIARSANRTATALATTKAGVAEKALDTEVQKLGISTAAEIEKLRIVTPVTP